MALRTLLAIASGFLFAFAFPDVGIAWLIFIALIPLFVALAKARNGWEAALLGWISQTTAWLLMVPWVVRVMSHYGGLPYATGVLIFIAMCLYLGLYGALFAFAFWRIRPGPRFRRWLLVPLAWAAVEYVRTYLMTGFPWSLIAAAVVDYTPLVQFDRVAGPYALGVLILLPATLIAWLVVRGVGSGRWGVGTKRQPTPDTTTKHTPIFAIAAVAIVTFVWFTTGYVAEKVIIRPTTAPMARAALLQPNI